MCVPVQMFTKPFHAFESRDGGLEYFLSLIEGDLRSPLVDGLHQTGPAPTAIPRVERGVVNVLIWRHFSWLLRGTIKRSGLIDIPWAGLFYKTKPNGSSSSVMDHAFELYFYSPSSDTTVVLNLCSGTTTKHTNARAHRHKHTPPLGGSMRVA